LISFESDSQLKKIECQALLCTSLKSVTILWTVEVIGKESFGDCKMLSSVIFDKKSHLERIEPGAFKNCKIRAILLPSPVEFIAEDAFALSCRVTRAQQPQAADLEASTGDCCHVS
jgi:hypothetical protein